MKRFLINITLFLTITFLVMEVVSRLVIDPVYFYKLNTFDVKKASGLGIYSEESTQHVDYLFLGSSRVPATINASWIADQIPGKNVVVAGRGYMTAGILYQGLKNKIQQYPGYLKDAKVIIEYSGNRSFVEPFEEEKMKVYEPMYEGDEAMPQLLVPHLNASSLMDYLENSPNSPRVKADMFFSWCFASRRSSDFVHDMFLKLDKPLFGKQAVMAEEGGIRNDKINAAREKAEVMTEARRKVFESEAPFSFEQLDASALYQIVQLVRDNGGEVLLYELPLHSLQKGLYKTDRQIQNKEIFERWLDEHNIAVLKIRDSFHYSDDDFPDIWHLSEERRDEFTESIFQALKAKEQQSKALNLFEFNFPGTPEIIY